MIQYHGDYLDFIADQGVGSNDRMASSPASYISYLNGVSKCLGVDITPALLRNERDVQEVARKIERQGTKAAGTIRNYISAMRQYVAMVAAKRL